MGDEPTTPMLTTGEWSAFVAAVERFNDWLGVGRFKLEHGGQSRAFPCYVDALAAFYEPTMRSAHLLIGNRILHSWLTTGAGQVLFFSFVEETPIMGAPEAAYLFSKAAKEVQAKHRRAALTQHNHRLN